MSFKEFFTGGGVANSSYGIFGIMHILWIVVPFILLGVLYYVFRENKKAGQIFLLIIAGLGLVLRVIKYGYLRPILWEQGIISIVPFELCTVLSYVIPFTVFFKTKKLNAFIYPLAIIGGVITLLYPEWIFNGRGLNFNKLESLFVHIFLYYIPILSIAVGYYKFRARDFYKPILAMGVLLGYAYIANTYITPGSNHMFIAKNPLPINVPAALYMPIYITGFLVILLVMYSKDIIKSCKNKKQKT